jgi:hypothetical protein
MSRYNLVLLRDEASMAVDFGYTRLWGCTAGVHS